MRKLFFFTTILVLITACRSKENKIGEYLYLEKGPIIHTDNKCGQSSFYIKASEVYSGKRRGRFCSKCISEQQLKIIEQNTKTYVPMAERIKNIRAEIKAMQNELSLKSDSAIELCKSINNDILWVDVFEKILDLQIETDLDFHSIDFELEEIQEELNAVLQ